MTNQINAKRLATLRAQYDFAYSSGEPVLSIWKDKHQAELIALEAWGQDNTLPVPLPIDEKFIVAYSTGTQNKLTDHWEVTDTKEEALARYAEVLELPDLYLASVFSKCIVSTDYDCSILTF